MAAYLRVLKVPLTRLLRSLVRGTFSTPDKIRISARPCNVLFIDQDHKTSCGLIRDGLFTNWKFRFYYDPRLHENFLYLSFSTLYSSSLWRNDTIVVSLNILSPPSQLISALSNGLEKNQPRRQGFSLKKWPPHPFFKGKALATRLEKNKPPSGGGGLINELRYQKKPSI